MTWHISKEGVTNLIERARVRGHKQADSLERWLINEVYPELPKEVQPKPIVPTVVQPANETTPETTTGCILRVDVNDQQEQVVSGRLLHQFWRLIPNIHNGLIVCQNMDLVKIKILL